MQNGVYHMEPKDTNTRCLSDISLYDEPDIPLYFDDSDEVSWIPQNLKLKKCTRFVSEDIKDGDGSTCQCGLLKKQHEPTSIQNDVNNKKWDSQTDTSQEATNAFGDVLFTGYGVTRNEAKFARVADDTNTQDLVHLLLEKWNLPEPKLLISVTGSAKNFTMQEQLEKVFHVGLAKVVSTGAWIITGGTNTGVMKLVGEAVRTYMLTSTSRTPIVAIGISSWGCIDNKECLIETDGNGKWPARYVISRAKDRSNNGVSLDPNHSHHILVDNGTEHKFGVEIALRAELEREIAASSEVSIPVVLLVIQGGLGTLRTVMEAVTKGTPVVLVKGCGQAADLLVDIYDYNRGAKNTSEQPLLPADLAEMLKGYLGVEGDIVEECTEQIKEIMNNTHLLCVFDADEENGTSTSDIDVAILRALLKGKSDQSSVQLGLALAWNRIDIAKSDIFSGKQEWTEDILKTFMLRAIEQPDRLDFVDMFIKKGVVLESVLSVHTLEELYTKTQPGTLLYTMFSLAKKKSCEEGIRLEDVGSLIETLLGDFYKSKYRDPHYVDALRSKKQLDDSIQHLFVWAVLQNREELATFLWQQNGQERLSMALIANSLFKAMADFMDDSEVEEILEENAKKFNGRAIGLLNCAFKTDEKMARNLLVRDLEHWEDTTCLTIASEADNKEFISQMACKSLMNRIWMGRLYTHTGYFKLLACALCPFVAMCKLNFRKKVTTKKDENRSKPHQNHLHRDTNDVPLTPGKKMGQFISAPVVKYIYNMISYICFLGLFSYYMLVDLHETWSWLDIVLTVWIVSLFTDEMRQVCRIKGSAVKRYFCNRWNIFDVFSIALYVTGNVLRSLPYSQTLEAARLTLAVDLILFYIRFLDVFSVNKYLGPKLVMIAKMMIDLVSFILIMLVFVLAYGVASYSVLYPNTNLKLTIFDVLKRPYWGIYGELYLESIPDEYCTTNITLVNDVLPRCPSKSGTYAVPIMLAGYVLVANILLLNLLIAIFSFTFQVIQDQTNLYWLFQRHHFIIECYYRPRIPPPFILISHIVALCLRCRGACKKEERKLDKFKKKSSVELDQWENAIANRYILDTELTKSDTVENMLQLASHRSEATLQQLGKRIEAIETQMEGFASCVAVINKETTS